MTKRKLLDGWFTETPCPEARMLVSEVDLDLACQRLPDEVAKRIVQGLADVRASEQIAAAVELRKLIAADYSDERLRHFVAHLRVRHRIAIDGSSMTLSEDLDPALLTATREELLAEGESLLERLKIIYTVSSLRDAQVDRLRKISLYILVGLLVALVATRLPSLFKQQWVSEVDMALNLGVIALCGGIGSLVSIMRRSQKALDLGPIDIDPVRQISALRHGASGMLIAAMVGPVLALVLFAVFAGHMIEIHGLTPKIGECGVDIKDVDKAVTCHFSFLGTKLGFVSAADPARMAIWAFLAGFAEQLVPDVLDKFSKAAKEPKPA